MTEYELKIPNDVRFAVKTPGVKKALILEFPEIGQNPCKNCNGNGIIAMFLCFHGPYDGSPGLGAHENVNGTDVHLVGKAERINGVWKWWAGYTVSAPCPVCQDMETGMAKEKK